MKTRWSLLGIVDFLVMVFAALWLATLTVARWVVENHPVDSIQFALVILTGAVFVVVYKITK